MVRLNINGKNISADEKMTILEARKQYTDTFFCHMTGVNNYGSCRICVVEVEGAKNLLASCITPVREGMVVRTNTPKVRKTRKLIYELMLSDHPKDCLNCERNQSCELQKLGELLGVTQSRFEGERSKTVIDDSSPSIVRDMVQMRFMQKMC